jgi:recombination protein U
LAANAAGYAFEREIRVGGETQGIHIRKIPITKYATFAKDGVYDFFAVWKGIPAGIEAKASKTEQSFPFSRLEPHQILALKQIHDCGGRGYILINVRTGRKQKCYVLPILLYLDWRAKFAAVGRKSIPLPLLQTLPELDRLQRPSCWDIRKLFDDTTYYVVIVPDVHAPILRKSRANSSHLGASTKTKNV